MKIAIVTNNVDNEQMVRQFIERKVHFALDRIDARVSAVLERRPGAQSQTSLSPDARRRNVRGAFHPRLGAGDAVRGRHVLLVEDVLTTGATAAEAASTLADMGAASVMALAFARALPRRRKRAA